MAENKAGRKKNELIQEEREWLENFFERADITYTKQADAVPSMSE